MASDDILKRARALVSASAGTPAKSYSGTLASARALVEAKEAGLDVYIAFDTTGSMGSYIDVVRENLETVTQNLLSESSTTRISMNGVGDHCDGEDCLQLYALTKDPKEVRSVMNAIRMTNGGDEPEAYECLALELARYIPTASERRKRAVVLVADSVPHGMVDGPCERQIDYHKTFEALKAVCEGFYLVGCNPQTYSHQRQLIDPARKDKERFIPLGDMVNVLPELLVALAKKTESAAKLEEYMKRLAPKTATAIRGMLGNGQ